MRRFAIILLFLAVNVQATTYYVANSSAGRVGLYYDGEASNDSAGTSPTTPFLTMAYAVTQLSAGDTLFIMGGLWNGSVPVVGTREIGSPTTANIFMLSGGTAGNPIVFKSYIGDTAGEPAVSVMAEVQRHGTGSLDTTWGAAFLFEDADYITIDSIHIDSTSVAGIYFFTCDHITIKNCVIHESYAWHASGAEANHGAIFYNGLDGNPGDTNYGALIYNNTIYNVYDHLGAIGSDNSNALHGRGLVSSIIRGNTIWRATMGMRLKSKCERNVIDSNFVYDTYEAGYCLGPGAKHDTIRFNTYWQGSGDGAGIMLQDNESYLALDSNVIYNNTLIGGRATRAGISLGDYSSTGAIDRTTIFNNIAVNFNRDFGGGGVYADELWKQFSDAELMIDYNCYYDTSSTDVINYTPSGGHQTLTEWQTISTTPQYDDNSVNVDPEFVSADTASANFLRLDTINSPEALLTGGRGGIWPTYMGAFDPYPAGEAASDSSAVMSGSVNISGNVRIE